LVIFISLVVAVLGVICMQQVNLDAIPDLSDPQVIILSEYPGQAPQVVEDQVTYPLTTAMLSVPKAKNVRGYSFFGFSLVYIIFEDGTDMYWARSRVLEYINFAKDKLPSQVSPALGPDATGVGWVYEYALVSDQHDLSELRSLQDWFIRFELSSVKGVSEVASVGGYVKQYQVEVDPNRLAAFGVNLSQIKQAIQRSNNDVGGKLIELSETEYMVRGLGYIKSLSDLEHIPIKTTQDGTPILIKNVANVQLGPDLRRGAAELNGEGEVAGGIVVMRYGENALEVINRVKQKLKEVKKGLPEGVEIVTTYDRSGLIERAVSNLSWKLIEEILIVALVCFIFLLHIPSVFISVLTLPLGILIAFIIMRLLGINANIMSLGGIAIAIGVMVDAAVVLVENTHKRLHQAMRSGELTAQKRIEVVIEASKEVGPSLFYALLIITVSFLPVFALEAQEGRLFKPLAFTKTFAMAASSLLAITIIPALLAIFVRGKIKDPEKNRLNKTLMKWYSPLLKKSLRFPKVIWGGAFLLLLITVIPYKYIGSEFMPPLNEGDLLYMPTTLPGISITKAKELLQQTSAIIKSHPEVTLVFGKVGRAKTATDPAPLSMIETTILLKDPKDWRSGMTIDKIRKELNEMVQFPGVTNSWTMPIKTRIDMLSTGIKTPVGIKLIGEDLEGLAKWGEEVESVLKTVPGTLSVFSERATGGYYLDFDIDREEAARHGLTTGDIQDVIQSAVGGMNVSMVIDGLERYPINVRYPRELRETPEDLERILIMTPTGAHIPLKQVASLEFKNGPPAIKTENARKTAWIYVDLDEVDIGSYVKNAKQVVNEKIKFPPGYAMIWSGQFEFMERAAERLKLVIPLTILLILFLLFIHFKSVIDTFIVMLSIPFSLVGGIWLMWALEYEISVAVAVGFISLLGLATETGVVMLVYLNQAYKDYLATEGEKSIATFDLAILKGATLRLRPVLMTVSTTLIGLVTVMIGSGTGTSVMQRIAAPMVGGLLTSTVLTLILIPVIFKLIKQRALDL
jgi:copper/silver efflux system protein